MKNLSYKMFMRTMQLNKIIIVILFTLFISSSYAAQSDKEEAINIWANELIVDKKSNTSTYTGQVKFEQGSIKIKCDTLTIHNSDSEIHEMLMISEKASQFEQVDDDGDKIIASAKKIHFLKHADTMSFQGNAILKQGNNIFKAESIFYDTAKNSLTSNTHKQDNGVKKDRVFISIQPE